MQTVNKSARSFAAAVSVVATLLVASVATPSQAEMITFGYTGTLTEVRDRLNVLDGSIVAGDPFSGWLSFDTDSPDGNQLPTFGTYYYIGQLFVQIGDIVALSPRDVTLGVSNLDDFDSFGLDGIIPFEYNGNRFSHVNWFIRDDDATMFDSDALPSIPPGFDEIDSTYFTLTTHLDLRYSVYFRGEIDSVFLVPEPATLLFLSALSLSCICRRPSRFRA